MNKLCCFPLNEPPEVNVKVHCVSSCCASDLNAKDEVDCNVSQSVSQAKHSNTYCCCKKRRSSESHAKEKEKEKDEVANHE